MATSWLHGSWGKFRNYERLLEDRLPRSEIGGAYKIWEYLLDIKSPNASDAGHLLDDLSESERTGALIYSSWFAANAQSIKDDWDNGSLGLDENQTSDSVSVELS